MSDLLTLAEAAAQLGVTPGVVRDLCNHVDARTGLHSPKLEHVRVGSVGRPNGRTGLRGAIRISRQAIVAYIEAHTHAPLPVTPRTPARAKYVRRNF